MSARGVVEESGVSTSAGTRGVYRGDGPGGLVELRCVAASGRVLACFHIAPECSDPATVLDAERWLDAHDPVTGDDREEEGGEGDEAPAPVPEHLPRGVFVAPWQHDGRPVLLAMNHRGEKWAERAVPAGQDLVAAIDALEAELDAHDPLVDEGQDQDEEEPASTSIPDPFAVPAALLGRGVYRLSVLQAGRPVLFAVDRRGEMLATRRVPEGMTTREAFREMQARLDAVDAPPAADAPTDVALAVELDVRPHHARTPAAARPVLIDA